jgi:hypothetical protein
MDTPTCSTCRIEMQPGFVPEFVGDSETVAVSHWYPDQPRWVTRTSLHGSPQRHRWIEYDHNRALTLDAWRCPKCGRVDFFALRHDVQGANL